MAKYSPNCKNEFLPMHHKIKCQLMVSWLFAEASQLPPNISYKPPSKPQQATEGLLDN